MNAPHERDAGAKRGGLPIAEAIGTRRLVIAIVTMPIIAIVAVVLIILYAQGRGAQGDAGVRAAASSPSPVRLGPGGRVVETLSDGRHLIVRTQSESGGEIAVYDIATGARLHTIAVVVE